MRNWQSGHKAGHKMARKGSKRERLEAACAGQACSDARLTTARFDPNGDKFYGDTDRGFRNPYMLDMPLAWC